MALDIPLFLFSPSKMFSFTLSVRVYWHPSCSTLCRELGYIRNQMGLVAVPMEYRWDDRGSENYKGGGVYKRDMQGGTGEAS